MISRVPNRAFENKFRVYSGFSDLRRLPSRAATTRSAWHDVWKRLRGRGSGFFRDSKRRRHFVKTYILLIQACRDVCEGLRVCWLKVLYKA